MFVHIHYITSSKVSSIIKINTTVSHALCLNLVGERSNDVYLQGGRFPPPILTLLWWPSPYLFSIQSNPLYFVLSLSCHFRHMEVVLEGQPNLSIEWEGRVSFHAFSTKWISTSSSQIRKGAAKNVTTGFNMISYHKGDQQIYLHKID